MVMLFFNSTALRHQGEAPRTLFCCHNGDQYPEGLLMHYGVEDPRAETVGRPQAVDGEELRPSLVLFACLPFEDVFSRALSARLHLEAGGDIAPEVIAVPNRSEHALATLDQGGCHAAVTALEPPRRAVVDEPLEEGNNRVLLQHAFFEGQKIVKQSVVHVSNRKEVKR